MRLFHKILFSVSNVSLFVKCWTLSSLVRLVCASTVEENILKKANQKKVLGDIAIESGAFTTDFFKQVPEPVSFVYTCLWVCSHWLEIVRDDFLWSYMLEN